MLPLHRTSWRGLQASWKPEKLSPSPHPCSRCRGAKRQRGGSRLLKKTRLRKNHSKDRNLWSALTCRETEEWVSLSKEYQATRTKNSYFSLWGWGGTEGIGENTAAVGHSKTFGEKVPKKLKKGKGACFSLNVSFSTKFMRWNPIPNVMVLGHRTFGRSRGWSPHE